jgi:hypothetical protein
MKRLRWLAVLAVVGLAGCQLMTALEENQKTVEGAPTAYPDSVVLAY